MKKILYISIEIPSITQTFVDREIRVLQKSGHDVRTVSRFSSSYKDMNEDDLNHYSDTLYLEKISLGKLLLRQLQLLCTKPKKVFHLISVIFREKEVKGTHDIFRLFYHYLEAGYVAITFKNQGIEHIHANFLNAPTSIAYFVSRFLDLPFSFTMHASNIFVDPLMLETKILSCKKAVTISQYNKDYLCEKYGSQINDKIEIIHCGIDVEKYRPVKRIEPEIPMILSVGRLVKMKGFGCLLEACHHLKEKGLEFSCCIVGDGDEKNDLIQTSKDLGVAGFVDFIGVQPHERILQLLQQASIFVLPCQITGDGMRDGIPVALMEAMAMELPVVSTDVVGIPELINSGENGVLVEQKKSAELAEAIEHLLMNFPERVRLGRKARMKIVDEFNINNVPRLFEAVLR